MFGKHIGQLNVFQATNSSEMLVWSLSGNQGDKWMFTQATLQAEDRFKFILESVTKEGSEGDIGVDDVTVLEERCHLNTERAGPKSPHCYFNHDMCNWKTSGPWVLINHHTGKKGGFLSLKPGGNKLGSTITSPLLDGEEWKCMRFWYRIGLGHGAHLKVLMSRSNTTQQLWRTSHRTSNWSFVQLSINTNKMARVMINNIMSITWVAWVLN